MFEIGFTELLLIGVVGLLVIGPERLPEALRTLGLWVGRMRRSFNNVKAEIEKEIGMDEIRRQLHNEAVMEEMKRIERDVRDSVNASASAHRPAGTEPATPGAAGDVARVMPPNGSQRSAELPGNPSANASTNASTEPPDGTSGAPADGEAAEQRSTSEPNDLPRDG